MDKRIVNAFAILILTAWFTSFILQALVKDYDPPDSVNILATMAAGSAFGASTLGAGISALTRKKEPPEGASDRSQ